MSSSNNFFPHWIKWMAAILIISRAHDPSFRNVPLGHCAWNRISASSASVQCLVFGRFLRSWDSFQAIQWVLFEHHGSIHSLWPSLHVLVICRILSHHLHLNIDKSSSAVNCSRR
jgi:hypothetical protein